MKLFVGCYTKKVTEELVGKGEGIYVFDFDQDNGTLKLKNTFRTINPSYLTISANEQYLYALEELPIDDNPHIHSFKIDGYNLIQLNKQKLPGSFSCHLALSEDQKNVLVASYMSGVLLNFPVNEDGSLNSLAQKIVHSGTGPNEIRQEAPHVHMIYPVKKNRFYAVDLGLDRAKAYEVTNGEIIANVVEDLTISPGSGARHMVTTPSGKFAFLFSELDSKIYSFRLDYRKPKLIESITSLPESYTNTPSGAAIRMHPNGKFIYVSNRGYDHITIFEFDSKTEKISLKGYKSTEGKTPREINIDPTGKWLICANQDSDNLVIFSIDKENGLLTTSSINKDVKTACCLVFQAMTKGLILNK